MSLCVESHFFAGQSYSTILRKGKVSKGQSYSTILQFIEEGTRNVASLLAITVLLLLLVRIIIRGTYPL